MTVFLNSISITSSIFSITTKAFQLSLHQTPSMNNVILGISFHIALTQIVSMLHIPILHEMPVNRIRYFGRPVVPFDINDDRVSLRKTKVFDGTNEVRLIGPIRVQIHAISGSINGVIFVVDVTLRVRNKVRCQNAISISFL